MVVTRLDRLARSTSDLLQILWTINRKGGFFFSIAEPWANTQSPLGKLMLTILGGIAEFERDLTAIRTAEGRARAKEAGVKSGPKPKLSFHQVEEIKRRRATGESCRFLARSYKVSTNTISRIKPVESCGAEKIWPADPQHLRFLKQKPPNGAVAIRHVSPVLGQLTSVIGYRLTAVSGLKRLRPYHSGHAIHFLWHRAWHWTGPVAL